MKHFTLTKFWDYYNKLPKPIQKKANENYELLKSDQNHPSLQFKKVGIFWSIRISKKYRALAYEKDNNMYWFWIGSHNEYDKLIK